MRIKCFYLSIIIFVSLYIFTMLQYKRKDHKTEINELQPHVDKSPLSEEELIEIIQNRVPSLPILYWKKVKDKKLAFNSSCAKFPNLFELEYNNIYWQTLQTSNGTFQLFGAYLDNRTMTDFGPTIRILGMIDRSEPTIKTFCQIWFDGLKQPVIVEVLEYNFIWIKEWHDYWTKMYHPYLMSCLLPDKYRNKVPVSVSVVEKPCHTASNILRVIYDRPVAKNDFAVCVKGLDFHHEDISVKLAEWIELIKLLGADKIFFYELNVHPNISKVLAHYQQEGYVHVTPISLPGGQPNIPDLQHLYIKKYIHSKRQNELIPYNDCFYKHMYQYKFIALLDVDEIIMPVAAKNWIELINDVVIPKAREIKYSAYEVRNIYFQSDLDHTYGWIENIPNYMHMLQHVYRAKDFDKPGHHVKSFFDTENALTIHNHLPLSCLGSGCFTYSINISDAQLQHYHLKSYFNKDSKVYDDIIMDTTIWRYKNELVNKVIKMLKTLKYF